MRCDAMRCDAMRCEAMRCDARRCVTDYCDITGETSWVREMIANHDSDARATGARIVHLCGHDSVPWDLSTYKLAQHLAPEKISSVDFYDEIKSAPSGGTLETALGIMFGAEKNKKKSDRQLALGFDPLMTTLDGKESNSGVSVKNVSTLLTKGNDSGSRWGLWRYHGRCC